MCSPDAGRVVYLADQEVNGVNELYNGAPDGTSLVKVNGALVSGVSVDKYSWSPDCNGLVKLNAPLVSGGDVSSLIWSPGSGFLAYRADTLVNNKSELFTVKPDGCAHQNINVPLIDSGDVLAPFFWNMWAG